MKTEAALLSEIAAAPTLAEQRRLVGELDALRNSKTALAQQDRDWDAAGTVVEQTLTPVLAHSMHTASTDWLSEADIPAVDSNAVHAEAALWFGKTSAMVKQDDEEFTEQAKGVARRLASQFGEAAPEAQRLFMDYVAFLRRREGASGLDQIQQLVDSHENPKRTNLPEDTYDTFQDPIAPENQGVDEMQSTENAPLLNEILNNAPGHGTPEVGYQHEESQTFTGPTTNGSGMQVGASLVDAPTPAVGYLYNMDDFLASQAAIQQTAARETDDQEDHTSSGDLSVTAGEVPDSFKEHQFGKEKLSDAKSTPGVGKDADGDDAPDNVDLTPRKKEAASGLDQVEQVVDSQENPKPTPLPTDVAFPLIPYFANPENKTLDAAKTSTKIAASVDEMVREQAGSDNPMLGKTHVGEEKKVAEPQNAMQHATHKASLSKEAAAEYRKGATFAANWQPGSPIVRQGSAEFEAGLYAGITANAAAQEAWLAEHEKWGATDEGIRNRIAAHAKFTEALIAEAGTTTDWDGLDGMTPGQGSPGPTTPIQGPGEEPPLAGGMDPAAPGGAAPYNGAAPYSRPVAPDPGWRPQDRVAAFQATIAANLKAREQ